MQIKLTTIPTKKIKNSYQVILTVMHGDADKFDTIRMICKNADEFIKMMKAVKTQPLDGSAGGDEKIYSKWCEDNFGEDTVPYDIIFSGTSNRAKVDGIEGFYYDDNGVKFNAELVE